MRLFNFELLLKRKKVELSEISSITFFEKILASSAIKPVSL